MVEEVIDLVLTPHMTEAKENASLLIWGSVVHIDEYAPSIQGFAGGVDVAPTVMSLALLGFGLVPSGLSLVAVLLVVPSALLDFGTRLPRPGLLIPESTERTVLGDWARPDPPAGQCRFVVLECDLRQSGSLPGGSGTRMLGSHTFRRHRDFACFFEKNRRQYRHFFYLMVLLSI